MNLFEQIMSFSFSFLYGIIVSHIYTKFYSYLYYQKKIYNILNSYFFCFLVTIIYFKTIYFINGGIVNLYFILLFVIGFIFYTKIFTKKMSKK